MALLSGEGWLFLLRWFHFLAGITWIGMLYYFNFVQTPFFAGAEPAVRSGMIVGSLVGRALWWFRWGAMFTFITGWLIVFHKMGQYGGVGAFFDQWYGWAIFTGGVLGTVMWANVWFVIWPNQQKALGLVDYPAERKPEAARTAMLTSRLNTALSIPMLFCMVAQQNAGL